MKYTFLDIRNRLTAFQSHLPSVPEITNIGWCCDKNGAYSPSRLSIRINPKLSSKVLDFVLAHELGHACRFQFVSVDLTAEQEEQFADMVAIRIFNMMSKPLPEFGRRFRTEDSSDQVAIDAVSFFFDSLNLRSRQK